MNDLAVAIVSEGQASVPEFLRAGPSRPIRGPWSKRTVLELLAWFKAANAEQLLLFLSPGPVIDSMTVERLLAYQADTGAAMVYSDYFDVSGRHHPLIDYQLGSLRDTFDFGPLVLLNKRHLAGLSETIEKETPDLKYGGWYDLRLRLSESGPLAHLAEPLYRCSASNGISPVRQMFDYLDPKNREVQLEMEKVATSYLKRIGAYLEPPAAPLVPENCSYPLEASVIIPVKDRVRTIAEAVRSALAQKTSFPFNVIVVDNHSGDGTSELLADIARGDRRLVHLVPERADLLIGGCWNEAIFSEACGRYAVQLDSDDLYDGDSVLERLVGAFRGGPYALVIGSYTTVDFNLQPVPPGLVDHREWTDANGHNNALRIAGLGAPRAYHVPTLRRIGFPNVSYGEDYAVVLRLCRTWRVGRIYESLYWCRRWEGNTDAAPPLEVSNQRDAYKDSLRTAEIIARQKMNP